MSRPREFERAEVLEKALPVFWHKGYAATSLKDLEEATGVNKSGLYSEFKDKQDLFLASLRHYYENRRIRELLKREPFGWQNIEDYIKATLKPNAGGTHGCFGVNTLREIETIGPDARKIIEDARARLRSLFAQNIVTAKSERERDALAGLVLTFHYGIQAEQNLRLPKASIEKRIEDFIATFRTEPSR